MYVIIYVLVFNHFLSNGRPRQNAFRAQILDVKSDWFLPSYYQETNQKSPTSKVWNSDWCSEFANHKSAFSFVRRSKRSNESILLLEKPWFGANDLFGGTPTQTHHQMPIHAPCTMHHACEVRNPETMTMCTRTVPSDHPRR
jgi:hypothetical protein